MILTTVSLSTYVLASSLLLTIPSTVAVVATVKGRAAETGEQQQQQQEPPAQEEQRRHKSVQWEEDEYDNESSYASSSSWNTPTRSTSSSHSHASSGSAYRHGGGPTRSLLWGKQRHPLSRSPTPSLTSSSSSHSTITPHSHYSHAHHSHPDPHARLPTLPYNHPSHDPSSADFDPEEAGAAWSFEVLLGDYVRQEELEDRLEELAMKRGRQGVGKGMGGGWVKWMGELVVGKERVLTREEERIKAFREWVDRE